MWYFKEFVSLLLHSQVQDLMDFGTMGSHTITFSVTNISSDTIMDSNIVIGIDTTFIMGSDTTMGYDTIMGPDTIMGLDTIIDSNAIT